MFQRISAPAFPLFDRLSTGAGRRISGLVLVVLIEALLLLLVLTLGRVALPDTETTRRTTVVSIRAEEIPAAAPEASREEPQQKAQAQPRPQQQPAPQEPSPQPPTEPATPPVTPPTPRGIVRMDWSLPPTNPMRLPDRPAQPARPVYGPADVRSAAMRDTPRVGTAPNGEPLYAAEWYREPAADMMRAYLSGARGPGWGLIACRTAPDFRVEDCVALDEYPNGSNITRSALAAAWEFRVRPPRRGGMPLIGSWVRIRIDYH